MFKGIEFNGDLFNCHNCYNLMDRMTQNMIVICETPRIKNIIWKEIEKICNGKCERDGHDYYIPKEQENRGEFPPRITKYGVHYLPTTQIIIDEEQKITLTIEAPFVLTAKSIEDIWFACLNGENKISIYPMIIFHGSKGKWDQGISEVYSYICQGKYGSYNGYWLDKESINNNRLYGKDYDAYSERY